VLFSRDVAHRRALRAASHSSNRCTITKNAGTNSTARVKRQTAREQYGG
jgi:hypothetical protein